MLAALVRLVLVSHLPYLASSLRDVILHVILRILGLLQLVPRESLGAVAFITTTLLAICSIMSDLA